MMNETKIGDDMSQTVYFTREFTDGVLKGLHHPDKITFPNLTLAARWIKRFVRTGRVVRKSRYTSSYIVVDASFQNYQR